jgi:PAS domain S-box-containing protein
LTEAQIQEALAILGSRKGGSMHADALRHLVHELRVHQTELEAQNLELTESQRALELSRDRFANLYDFAPIGYLSLTPRGLVTEVNLRGASLLGRMPAALLNYPFSRVVTEEDRPRFLDHLSRCGAEGSATTELSLTPKDGGLLPVQLYSVLATEAEHGTLLLTAMSDIGERKRAEAALLQIHEELEQRVAARTAELSAAVGSLEDIDRRKDHFLAVMAHELRNPLAPIVTAAYLLKLKGPEDRDTIAWATEIIGRQAAQMQRLIDDLLDVSRVSQGKIALRRKCLSLSEVVMQAAEAARPKIEQRELHFSLDLPARPIWVDADAARMVQIVANLLDNAAKFTAPGGSIHLAVGFEDGEAVIRVRDTGEGISPDLLPHIFEAFTQAESSLARDGAGLGLGLSLVSRLVAMHGGWVNAASAGIGKGAEFEVRLPALKEAPAVRETAEAGLQAPAAHARRILLAEDNIAAAESLAGLLRHLGHAVTVTHDGAAALAAAGIERPEIAILDIGLPEMDGYALARRLRELPGGDRALLVALTGYGTDADRLQARAAGFDHHLVKPADMQQLLALIENGERRDPSAVDGDDQAEQK